MLPTADKNAAVDILFVVCDLMTGTDLLKLYKEHAIQASLEDFIQSEAES